MRSFLLEKKMLLGSPFTCFSGQQKGFVTLPPSIYSDSFLANLKWEVWNDRHQFWDTTTTVNRLNNCFLLTSQSTLCVCYAFILTAARKQEHSNHPGGLQWLSVDKWQWMSFIDFLVIPLHCLLDKVILPASHAVFSHSNVKAKEIIHFFFKCIHSTNLQDAIEG